MELDPCYHLPFAIRRGDTNHVRVLLENGAHLEMDAPARATHLVEAVSSPPATVELLSLLLDAGFDPNGVDMRIGEWYATTPFMAAARHGRLDLMQCLEQAGADPCWTNTNGANAASMVLPSSSTQDRCDPTPERALIAAWLEERNIRFSPDCAHSRMKLFYAAYTRHSWQDIPGHLERGIDPACLKWTPFMFRIVRGEATIAEAAALPAEEREHRDSWDRTPFLLAVTAGRVDLTEALLKAGCDPFATGRCGKPALHYAAEIDHASMISWLLSVGCPVDSCDDFGATPLKRAVQSGEVAAARVLLQGGADVLACNSREDQAIHEAGDRDMIALLLSAGADVNAISGCGYWPLKAAAREGNAALIRFLLETGAAVDLTSTGETALFSAIYADSIECVRILLEAGADINAQDCDGQTCLKGVRSTVMATELLFQGADSSIPDEDGELPEDNLLPPAVSAMLRAHRMASEEKRKHPGS